MRVLVAVKTTICIDIAILTGRLNQLEHDRTTIEGQVKYLRGLDQSQLLLTPQAVREEFNQVPVLLMSSPPGMLNRALKPLFNKNSQLKLEVREEGKKKVFWGTGSLDMGKVVGISRKISGDAIFQVTLIALYRAISWQTYSDDLKLFQSRNLVYNLAPTRNYFQIPTQVSI